MGADPTPGEIFRNPGLARTLKTIAEGGKKAFYEGEIAEAIVSILHEAGGCMQLDDLADTPIHLGSAHLHRSTAACASGNAHPTGRGWPRCWR